MKYSDLLNSYIEDCGLTLEQISDECKKQGVTIHPTYISKLRKGLRPSPTEDISQALAISCGKDPTQLVFLGYLEKTPSPIIQKFSEYEGLFNVVKQTLLQMCNDDEILGNLSKHLGYKLTFEQLCDMFQKLSISDQLNFIIANGISIHLDEAKENEVNVWLTYNETNQPDQAFKESASSYSTKNQHIIVPPNTFPLPDHQIIDLPVYGEIRATKNDYAAQDYQGTQKWITKSCNCSGWYMLQIKGDSMTPRFLPGDFAIVRPQNDVDSGDIAIAVIDNKDVAMKRIKKYADGVVLKSDNALFEDREFLGEDYSRVRIIGKVIDIKAGRL